jgi:hypothetical protein
LAKNECEKTTTPKRILARRSRRDLRRHREGHGQLDGEGNSSPVGQFVEIGEAS